MVPMESNELTFWQSRSVVGGKLSAPFELTDIPKLAKDVRHAAHAAPTAPPIAARDVTATAPRGKWLPASDVGGGLPT